MNEGQGVLLTGATGALGPELAVELLGADPNRLLYVLVRDGLGAGTGGIAAADRFDAWLGLVATLMAQQPVEATRWRERVRLVPGDLRRDALGMSAQQCKELAARTNVIVHAAADTQFLSSFED